MKKGTRVKWRNGNRIGISLGRTHKYTVDWVIVEWRDGTKVLVYEGMLEVICEGR